MNTVETTTNQAQDSITLVKSNTVDRESLLAAGDTFKAYDSQLPIAHKEGCRVVKVCYKTNTKTGKKAGENSYVYIPDTITPETVGENIDRLLPLFISYLQAQEDEIVRALHKVGTVTVYPTNVGMLKVMEALEYSDGGRLNKEQLESWFDGAVADGLKTAFADRLGTTVDAPKVLDIVANYKKRICSLASPKVSFPKPEVETLLKALATVVDKDTDMLASKLVSKLEKMLESDDVLLMSL